MKSHEPFHPLVLEQMYEHPERFTHMDKTEYFRLLIEDIRHWRDKAETYQRMYYAEHGEIAAELDVARAAIEKLADRVAELEEWREQN